MGLHFRLIDRSNCETNTQAVRPDIICSRDLQQAAVTLKISQIIPLGGDGLKDLAEEWWLYWFTWNGAGSRRRFPTSSMSRFFRVHLIARREVAFELFESRKTEKKIMIELYWNERFRWYCAITETVISLFVFIICNRYRNQTNITWM